MFPKGDGKPVMFIRDYGAGFDPRYPDKRFGGCRRRHSQSNFDGAGIVLANVQAIIHRHGGEAWAEGVANTGAIFYFQSHQKTEASTDTKTNMEQKSMQGREPIPVAFARGRAHGMERIRPPSGCRGLLRQAGRLLPFAAKSPLTSAEAGGADTIARARGRNERA